MSMCACTCIWILGGGGLTCNTICILCVCVYVCMSVPVPFHGHWLPSGSLSHSACLKFSPGKSRWTLSSQPGGHLAA